MASDDIPKEIEMLMEKVYDQFRQIYASTTYDSDTKVRMLGTDRPRDGVHSGKWVVVSTNEYREEITVGMKRGGVAGNFAKKQTVSFENATVNDVMEMARSYIPENRVWNEEEVVEDTNPATVEREDEAVKEEMGEDMVLPSETRGMMMKLQSVLQSQYGYVDVREQGSEGIEIQVKHSASPRGTRVDFHSGTWVIITANVGQFENSVRVGLKRGGVAGTFDKKNEFSLLVDMDTVLSQVQAYL